MNPMPVVCLSGLFATAPAALEGHEGDASPRTLEAQSPWEPPASLEPEEHDIHVGIATGLFLSASERTLMADGEPVGSGPAGLQFSLRFDYLPWRFLGMEVEAGHVAQESPPNETLGLFKLGGHALIQWPGRLTPFFLLGGGVLGATSDARQLDETLRPEAHWGVGTKWYLQHEILVRAELRHLVDLVNAGPVHQFETLLGLSFRLN